MANRIKNINGVDVEMTDAEQAAFEADIVATNTGLPVRTKRNELSRDVERADHNCKQHPRGTW